jgi:hypothetical protein
VDFDTAAASDVVFYTHTEVVFGLYGSSDGLRSFFVSGSDMKGQG